MHISYHDTLSLQVKRGAKKPTDPMFKQQWFLNHGAKVRNQLDDIFGVYFVLPWTGHKINVIMHLLEEESL